MILDVKEEICSAKYAKLLSDSLCIHLLWFRPSLSFQGITYAFRPKRFGHGVAGMWGGGPVLTRSHVITRP